MASSPSTVAKATLLLAFCLAAALPFALGRELKQAPAPGPDVTPAKLEAALDVIAEVAGEPVLATYAKVPAILDFFVDNAEGPSAAIIQLAADAAAGPAAPPADVTVAEAIYAGSPLDLFSLPPEAQQLYNGIEGFQNLAAEAALIFGGI